jgi:hypothetical protein
VIAIFLKERNTHIVEMGMGHGDMLAGCHRDKSNLETGSTITVKRDWIVVYVTERFLLTF